MRAAILAVLLALPLVPGGLHAQGRDCTLQSSPGSKLVTFNANTPGQQMYIGGGARFVCPDGTVIVADSAIIIANGDQRILIGHAVYRDHVKSLSAAQINYRGAQGYMHAQSDVVLTDLESGSVITGDILDYYPAKDSTPATAIVYGGRPHALLKRVPQPQTPGASPRSSDSTRAGPVPVMGATGPGSPDDTMSTEVDADRFQIQNQRKFQALGHVVLTRPDMTGTGASALYDPDADHLQLTGDAKVVGSQFTLTGGTIDGTLEANKLKRVVATYKAELQSKDLRVRAPSIAIRFEQGLVEGLVALSAERAKRPAGEGKELAEASARDFYLQADSINALTPDQKIEQVVAVGHARGEQSNDSIKAKLPAIASKNWLEGDTITGYFVDAPPIADSGAAGVARGRAPGVAAAPPPESSAPARAPAAEPDTAQQRVLDRVVAVSAGSELARSLYVLFDQKKPDVVPPINYVKAQRITLAFRGGQVSDVHLEGDVRGTYAAPENVAQPAKGDTATATKGQDPVADTRPAPGSTKP